jgi:hypothetical protein
MADLQTSVRFHHCHHQNGVRCLCRHANAKNENDEGQVDSRLVFLVEKGKNPLVMSLTTLLKSSVAPNIYIWSFINRAAAMDKPARRALDTNITCLW